MVNVNRPLAGLALAICAGTIFSIQSSGSDGEGQSKGKVRVSVTDVQSLSDSLVVHVRMDLESGARVTIKSDDTELSTLANSVGSQPDHGIVTIAVLADRLEWGSPKENAIKFLLSLHGKAAANTSETWRTTAGQELDDLITVTIKSGDYKLDKPMPFLKFKGKTYSLIVVTEPSKP
jgi:hypothetical protein